MHLLKLSRELLEGCREQSTFWLSGRKLRRSRHWGGAVLGSGEKLTGGMSRDYLSVWERGNVGNRTPEKLQWTVCLLTLCFSHSHPRLEFTQSLEFKTNWDSHYTFLLENKTWGVARTPPPPFLGSTKEGSAYSPIEYVSLKGSRGMGLHRAALYQEG